MRSPPTLAALLGGRRLSAFEVGAAEGRRDVDGGRGGICARAVVKYPPSRWHRDAPLQNKSVGVEGVAPETGGWFARVYSVVFGANLRLLLVLLLLPLLLRDGRFWPRVNLVVDNHCIRRRPAVQFAQRCRTSVTNGASTNCSHGWRVPRALGGCFVQPRSSCVRPRSSCTLALLLENRTTAELPR